MRTVLALAVLLTVLGAAAARALSSEPAPRLVDVHEIRFPPSRNTGTANCTNDDPSRYTTRYRQAGWRVLGAKTAYLNQATVPASLGEVTAVLQAAYDVWRAAEPNTPPITVAGGGTATARRANRTDELFFGDTGSIAVTYTWVYSDGHVESDVVFNRELSWFVAPAEGDGCYESVAAYDLQPPRIHMFYGFLVFLSIGLAFQYRESMRGRLELLYGLVGLFLMGLGLRAVFQVV